MVERISLCRKLGYNDTELSKEALELKAIYDEMQSIHDSGTPLYIEFLAGDREGSIAIIEPRVYKNGSTSKDWISTTCRTQRGYQLGERDPVNFILYNFAIYGQLKFAGKSHRPVCNIYPGSRDVVWLKGYNGPTVWKKFDVAAAKKEILEDPQQFDIEENLLNVGDSVLFCNLQYGSGARLMRGRIKEFKASVDSQREKVYTIVEYPVEGSTEMGAMKTEHPYRLILKV